MTDTLRLNASTTVARQESMTGIRNAFSNHGSWILDVHLFSNISINFNIEISSGHLAGLYEELKAIGLKFTRKSQGEVQKNNDHHSNFVGTLQVIFIHDEPDLRQVIPAVPG